jgi:diketogulonate reductase-like aldo/keto reductase
MSILNETYTLANDVAIPKLGLGTWFIDDDQAADAVKAASGSTPGVSRRMAPR